MQFLTIIKLDWPIALLKRTIIDTKKHYTQEFRRVEVLGEVVASTNPEIFFAD